MLYEVITNLSPDIGSFIDLAFLVKVVTRAVDILMQFQGKIEARAEYRLHQGHLQWWSGRFELAVQVPVFPVVPGAGFVAMRVDAWDEGQLPVGEIV